MTKDEIRKGVEEDIRNQLQLSPDLVLKDTDDLRDDLSADSLDVVELIMSFEDRFGIEIPEDEAEKHTTIGGIVDYLDQRINHPPSS